MNEHTEDWHAGFREGAREALEEAALAVGPNMRPAEARKAIRALASKPEPDPKSAESALREIAALDASPSAGEDYRAACPRCGRVAVLTTPVAGSTFSLDECSCGWKASKPEVCTCRMSSRKHIHDPEHGIIDEPEEADVENDYKALWEVDHTALKQAEEALAVSQNALDSEGSDASEARAANRALVEALRDGIERLSDIPDLSAKLARKALQEALAAHEEAKKRKTGEKGRG